MTATLFDPPDPVEPHAFTARWDGRCATCTLPEAHAVHATVEAVARSTDPPTSWAAAKSLGDLRESQSAVLAFLREHGPMTDEQLVARYDREPRQSPSGLRTRRKELVEDFDLVVDTGRKEKLLSGRQAIVWEAK